MIPGTDPIKILQRKFYDTQFFKHSDWLLKLINQSGCLEISVASNLCCKIFIGLAPGIIK